MSNCNYCILNQLLKRKKMRKEIKKTLLVKLNNNEPLLVEYILKFLDDRLDCLCSYCYEFDSYKYHCYICPDCLYFRKENFD